MPIDSGCRFATAGRGVGAEHHPPRDGRIYASVEFVDAIRDEDLEWLRNEGFEIVRIFRESNRVTVRIPDDYSKDPKDANPRIRRVDVQMR